MADDALEQIQSKIAYLERAINELSDVVFRQHNDIKALEAQVKTLRDRLQGAQFEETPRTAEQERPPHY
jgi:SlyX protein